MVRYLLKRDVFSSSLFYNILKNVEGVKQNVFVVLQTRLVRPSSYCNGKLLTITPLTFLFQVGSVIAHSYHFGTASLRQDLPSSVRSRAWIHVPIYLMADL